MSKIPIIGHIFKPDLESLKEADWARQYSARKLRDAERVRGESDKLQAALSRIRRENHFAEKFNAALRGVADE